MNILNVENYLNMANDFCQVSEITENTEAQTSPLLSSADVYTMALDAHIAQGQDRICNAIGDASGKHDVMSEELGKQVSEDAEEAMKDLSVQVARYFGGVLHDQMEDRLEDEVDKIFPSHPEDMGPTTGKPAELFPV